MDRRREENTSGGEGTGDGKDKKRRFFHGAGRSGAVTDVTDAVAGRKWERLASLVIVIAGAGAAVWLAGKYLLPALLPFLIAWCSAMILRPVCVAAEKKCRIPRRVTAVILDILLLSLLSFGLWRLGRRLFSEALSFLSRLRDDPDTLQGIFATAERWLSTIRGFLPVGTSSGTAGGGANEVIGGWIDRLLTSLPAWGAGVIARAPVRIAFFLVTVTASVYVSLDLDRINASFLSLFSLPTQEKIVSARRRFGEGAWRYVRAYLILMSITFGISLVGFWMMRVDYVLLLAVLCAVMDLLPVLGVGTVVLPWSVVCFFSGNSGRGLSLLLFYALAVGVREFLEPKILGREFNIPPWLTLVYLWAGLKLLGAVGLIAGPAIGVCVHSFLRDRKKTDG